MENNSVSKVNFAIENALSGNLKFKSSKDKLQELKTVANQFESIFVNESLKQARKSKIAEGLFDSQAEDTFNSMIDQEFSRVLSDKSNFGIAEALFEQFKNNVGANRKK